MSADHLALVYTEMLNDPAFKKRVASERLSALVGWYLTDEERALLIEEAQAERKDYSVAESKAIAYIARVGPISQTAGSALGNAINRAMRLPIFGPMAGGCDAGCCSWAARFNFQSLVLPM